MLITLQLWNHLYFILLVYVLQYLVLFQNMLYRKLSYLNLFSNIMELAHDFIILYLVNFSYVSSLNNSYASIILVLFYVLKKESWLQSIVVYLLMLDYVPTFLVFFNYYMLTTLLQFIYVYYLHNFVLYHNLH